VSDVVIVDSGVANLASIASALRRLGATVTVTASADDVRSAPRVVLPGVGAFGAGLAALRARGLTAAVREVAGRGTPLLGVCLGMQMLCERSEETPGVAGLGIIPGGCVRLPDNVRVPHLGWNHVAAGPGTRVVATGAAAFANSYALREAPAGWNPAWSTHGARFVAALERDAIVACQFHPELSGAYGAALLARWLQGDARAPQGADDAVPGLLRRIVPCLDVRDGRVVKGVRFQELRDAGDPAVQAARYEGQGADEIVVLDVAASPDGRRTHVATVERVRAAISIPLTAGGGVRSVADARALLAAGADKISVNTAALRRPALLGELAAAFGCQCVVLAIDARRTGDRRAGDRWEVLALGGRERALPDAVAWAQEGERLGAGEVLLTSWDRDGTRAGPDLELVRAVCGAVRIPVIASGGVGQRAHAAGAFAAGADAVLAASVFHDGDETVGGIKADLAAHGIRVRL